MLNTLWLSPWPCQLDSNNMLLTCMHACMDARTHTHILFLFCITSCFVACTKHNGYIFLFQSWLVPPQHHNSGLHKLLTCCLDNQMSLLESWEKQTGNTTSPCFDCRKKLLHYIFHQNKLSWHLCAVLDKHSGKDSSLPWTRGSQKLTVKIFCIFLFLFLRKQSFFQTAKQIEKTNKLWNTFFRNADISCPILKAYKACVFWTLVWCWYIHKSFSQRTKSVQKCTVLPLCTPFTHILIYTILKIKQWNLTNWIHNHKPSNCS